MDEITAGITSRLRKLRDHAGLTQGEMAEVVGYTKIYVWKLEKGLRMPSQAMVIALASKLKISEDWLRCGKGPMVVK